MKQVRRDILDLIKIRITVMQLVTVGIGYALAIQGQSVAWGTVGWLMVATFCLSGGVAALNHYFERKADEKMVRTQDRPLPSKRMHAGVAVVLGLGLSVAGLGLAFVYVNKLTGFICVLTAILYVLVYTPLKRVTWVNTIIGAIPGALPPLGGWAAAVGHLDIGAWLLFWWMFAWQHPHFYAIAWLYKDDYKKGGFEMLPEVDTDGVSTKRQIVLFTAMMIGCSVGLVVTGVLGWVYLVGAIVLGAHMAKAGWGMYQEITDKTAKKLLISSVIYLPVLVLIMILDRVAL